MISRSRTDRGAPADRPAGKPTAEQVSALLSARYGVLPSAVQTVPMGTETHNFRAHPAADASLFVKVYPGKADVARLQARLAVSEFARASRIPIPAVLRNDQGALVTTHNGLTASVWESIEAEPSSGALTLEQAGQVGQTLGRLHRRLAEHPTSGTAAPTVDSSWRSRDPIAAAKEAEDLLAVIDALTAPNGTDQVRRTQVAERREHLLGHAGSLQAGLPQRPLLQLLHCDYVMANLLFSRDRLAAVIDLRGKVASPAWELGRIAYDSMAIARSSDWRQVGLQVVSAYRQENDALPAAEVVKCARSSLLETMLSLYPADAVLYADPEGPVRDEGAAAYWHNRATMTARLLADLPDVEAELEDLIRAESP